MDFLEVRDLRWLITDDNFIEYSTHAYTIYMYTCIYVCIYVYMCVFVYKAWIFN